MVAAITSGQRDCAGMVTNYVSTTRARGAWPPVTAAPTSAVPRLAAPTEAATSAAADAPAGCTTTRSGSCIRGGEFCPRASEGATGNDGQGVTYVCRDSNSNGHLHWETP